MVRTHQTIPAQVDQACRALSGDWQLGGDTEQGAHSCQSHNRQLQTHICPSSAACAGWSGLTRFPH
jgi:hypothetical protein